MRMVVAVLAFGTSVALAGAQDKKDGKKIDKVTAEQLAKEFKDDATAAQKKYGGSPAPEFQFSCKDAIVVGSGKDNELLVCTGSKITIRVATDKRPAKCPTNFSATARYKEYFEMGKELSLTATSISYK